MKPQIKRQKRQRRKRRVTSRMFGTKQRPRLSVFRSHKHIHLQLIDDSVQKTLVSVKLDKKMKQRGIEQAKEVAKKLVMAAKKAGITTAVFDRGGYKYHGRVKAVAETARELGLKI